MTLLMTQHRSFRYKNDKRNIKILLFCTSQIYELFAFLNKETDLTGPVWNLKKLDSNTVSAWVGGGG